MGKLIIAIGFGIAVVLIAKSFTATRSEYPDSFQRALQEAEKRATEDFDGEPGRKAREICSRRLGISVPVKTANDVLRYYDLAKAKAFTNCVVDQM